ncbi:MAG: hypothetical protein ACRDQ1_21495, partial [Sciscionella sp.]
VILGAVFIAYLPERFRQFENYRVMVFAAIIVLIMIWRPQGLLTRKSRKIEAPQAEGGSAARPAEDVPAAELDTVPERRVDNVG